MSRVVLGKQSVQYAGRGWMIGGAVGVAMVFFLGWTFFPVGYAFIRSFSDWQPTRPQQQFVGLANYREVLFEDTLFWKAAGNTVKFTLANVIVGTSLCLIVAVMIDAVRSGRLATIYRTAYFLPLVSSMVGSALIWRTSIYQPRFGLLNTAMFGVADALGLPPPPEIGWLTRPQWALTSVTIMTIWKFMGFRMVTFLAGLQDIPASLYEAAEIDGAGPLARLRHITIPLLAPTFAFVLVISTTGSLQIFAPMFIMTEGGPMYATLTVVYLMYQKAFQVLRFGYAASVSFILFGVILILTVTQTRLLRPRWEY